MRDRYRAPKIIPLSRVHVINVSGFPTTIVLLFNKRYPGKKIEILIIKLHNKNIKA